MKKKNKAVEIFLICIFVLSLGCVCAYAEQDESLAAASGAQELFSQLPEQTKELFEALGVDDVDFDSIFNVTPSSVWQLFKKLLTGGIEAPTRSLLRLMAVIILMAICESFIPDDEKMKAVTETAGTLFCIISVISPLTTAISSAVSSISISESFMLLLIPVLAGVAAMSGNPTLAVSFQSIAFAAAQVIAAVSKNFIVPVVGAVLAIDITGAVMPSFKLSGITDFIKKTVTAALSIGATLFVSFLGLKGALANAADTVATKGMKLIISSAVPVVGGALSEAYSGIIGSMVLLKSTLGVFGMGAIALVNLPSCVQLLFWIFTLRLGAAVGELFNREGIAALLRAMASAITLLNVVLLFNAVLFIISTALILRIKAG